MVSLYFICNLFFSITSTMLWLCVPTGYTCALQKDILYQGKMFVSDNWICFHSKVFGRDTKVINQTHVGLVALMEFKRISVFVLERLHRLV